jgi:hypothetical protein
MNLEFHKMLEFDHLSVPKGSAALVGLFWTRGDHVLVIVETTAVQFDNIKDGSFLGQRR